ncbi:MAG TPA: hypothetical protein PLS38_09820 [Solirubrobacterales bacterium]|nr:hypothetical protein [Solirubrobacterales bacterium]HNC15238.1 hypothetical protein [Solirubrobacterales bacterium]HNH87201.1 hypothetical protein [Solirubrobacterales bacterium]
MLTFPLGYVTVAAFAPAGISQAISIDNAAIAAAGKSLLRIMLISSLH